MTAVKSVYTTGEVAEICGVTLRTVVNWIQRGELKAYKLPGRRGDNRIVHAELEHFMTSNNMPGLPQAHQQETQQAHCDVLVVDDEASMAKAIARVFKNNGYNVAIAQDGFEAGIKYASLRPRLVTLDLQMPKMDGLTMLARLTKEERASVAIISAANDLMLEKAKALGAIHILKKPFKNEDLVNLAQVFL